MKLTILNLHYYLRKNVLRLNRIIKIYLSLTTLGFFCSINECFDTSIREKVNFVLHQYYNNIVLQYFLILYRRI